MDTPVRQLGVGSARGARLGVLALAIGSTAVLAAAGGEELSGPPAGTQYYSTAAPPRDFPGDAPVRLAMYVPEADNPAFNNRVQPEPVMPTSEPPELRGPNRDGPPPALANVPRNADPGTRPRPKAASAPAAAPSTAPAEADPITFALQAITDCETRYVQVQDYTCTFLKRERIDGRLSDYHIMSMKARARPLSVYFKFQQPNVGREAIYVSGKHGGRILAHDVGIGKVIAGTLALDPRGSRAMEGNLHPVTDAGIGHLIDTVAARWRAEMKPGETQVGVHPNARVGARVCTMIESTHPQRSPRYLFYRVKVYIDHELGVPIRFEAYDWPHRAGEAPELVEEYTYMNLRLNTGLTDRDFDPTNKQYSFGRF
jgi:hypothetical protein